jgi:hypothetical protein
VPRWVPAKTQPIPVQEPPEKRHIVRRSVTSSSWIGRLAAQWRRELAPERPQYPQDLSGASLRK